MTSTPDMFTDVHDFHVLVLNDHSDGTPTLVSAEYCMERARFLAEELSEFTQAAMDGDIVGVADALADLVYVALGTAYKMGIPFDGVWNAVHQANMRKIAGTTSRGNKVDAMKPIGWVGPEATIARILGRAHE